MAKPNKTRYALLGFLAMQDASGYDIKKMMERSTNYFWRETDSSIYPILKQLLDEKKVKCLIENAESGKPKKVYSITDEGTQEFIEWLDEDPVFEQSRNELMLKVFFGWNTDKETTIKHIKKFQSHLSALEKKYRALERFGPDIENQNTMQIYQYLTLKSGLAVARTRLKWCEEAIKILEGKSLPALKTKSRKKRTPVFEI